MKNLFFICCQNCHLCWYYCLLLQKLNALPTITAKRDFLKRNNFAASSSVSQETGVQSLEPSISSDRSSRVTALEANWDLLDAAINIYRSNSTKDQSEIVRERYRKVLQNITLDTYSAFYRLASLQKFQNDIEILLDESDQKLAVLKQSQSSGDINFETIATLQKDIYAKRAELIQIKKLHKLAGLELKALLSAPPETKLNLQYQENKLDIDKRFYGKKKISKYVEKALLQRPEVKEELYNLRVAERNVNSEIFQTFPGLNLLASANDDDNSFLENDEWFSLTATLSQSITRLLTLPTRYKKSKQEVDLVNARRQALVAAVIYQVNIAYAEFIDTYKALNEERNIFEIKNNEKTRKEIMVESGLISGLESSMHKMQYTIDQIALSSKMVDTIIAEARLKHSSGMDFEGYSEAKVQANIAKKVMKK